MASRPEDRQAATSRWAAREAALAVELLGVKHVMPIHYETSPESTRAELRGGLSRTDTIAVACRSALDGTSISISNVMRAIAPDGIGIDPFIRSESPLGRGPGPETAQRSLQVWTGEPGIGGGGS